MNIPELKALPGRRGQWRVFCSWCRRSHSHGGLGPRWPHCTTPRSPYEQTGYVLVPGCTEHTGSAVQTVSDSRGWMAFTCAEGCWLGSVAT